MSEPHEWKSGEGENETELRAKDGVLYFRAGNIRAWSEAVNCESECAAEIIRLRDENRELREKVEAMHREASRRVAELEEKVFRLRTELGGGA